MYSKNGDAEGNILFHHNSIKNCKIKPNKSFDLSRSAQLLEHFEPNGSIFNLLALGPD